MKGKIFYIIAWSVGLLMATFPDFPCAMRFDFHNMEMAFFHQKYFSPFLMAASLFLGDVLYSLCGKEGPEIKRSLIFLLIGLLFFLLALLYSCKYPSDCTNRFFFILAWISLTFMKYVTTSPVHIPNPQQVNEADKQ